jgi:uroporphyrinogen-III synthase
MTRPLAAGQRFVGQLGVAVDTLFAPLMQIELIEAPPVGPGLTSIILTSENGALAAAQMRGLPKVAYCVGDRTAQVARDAGFDPISAQGDALALVELILSGPQTGPLLHIRGEHVRGDVAERLNAAGIDTQDCIAYRQQNLPLAPAAIAALMGKRPVILPLFSPRSVTILAEQGPFLAPLYVVSISRAVAKEAETLHPVSVTEAVSPQAVAMVQAVRACLALFTPG